MACAIGLLARGAAAQSQSQAQAQPKAQETIVVGGQAPLPGEPTAQAGSTVRRFELDERLPRSSPDALRYEPGVFVQQTAHGQGSPYLRGLTGQQTVILFDGIRLNTSTFRQGPNQYFFTLDAQTLEEIRVLRGGASTRFGSDALGGVLLARPREAEVRDGFSLRPALLFKGATADGELGGRLEAAATMPGGVSVLAGVGRRRVGLLESAGPVRSPLTGIPPEVPRFEEDGRTQLGTGFEEWTADARAVWRVDARQRLTLASYLYRQGDAPRTDQCPPPGARFDECLRYERQHRSLVYAAWDLEEGRTAALHRARATVSFQNQHERRRAERPASFVVNTGEDDVDTLGVAFSAEARPLALGQGLLEGRTLQLSYGADLYLDLLRSEAAIAFSDLGIELPSSRGQYVDGSRYLTGGAFGTAALQVLPDVVLRAGARAGVAHAEAPGDPASGSAAVSRAWIPFAAHAGAGWSVHRGVDLSLSVDRSFRAPNLDDLTSRQQAGPGFQFENASLLPETATTAELGARLRQGRVTLDAFAFHTWLGNAIGRRPVSAAECPPQTPQCEASRARFQLVNAGKTSRIVGTELSARVRLPAAFTASGGVSWTRGEGPNLADESLPPVPLSRIPPLNGAAEVSFRGVRGLMLGAGARWALAQTRLAVADLADARIPEGGTPGFFVVDLRATWRRSDWLRVSAVIENVFDAPYRYHGSSVNGAGRGVLLAVEVQPP